MLRQTIEAARKAVYGRWERLAVPDTGPSTGFMIDRWVAEWSAGATRCSELKLDYDSFYSVADYAFALAKEEPWMPVMCFAMMRCALADPTSQIGQKAATSFIYAVETLEGPGGFETLANLSIDDLQTVRLFLEAWSSIPSDSGWAVRRSTKDAVWRVDDELRDRGTGSGDPL